MTAWWAEKDMVFYNKKYEEEPGAGASLKNTPIIGIYFGTYLSRSTRILTKFIAKFHKQIRKNNANKFQIIFCSMDENEKDCQDFVKSVHGDWLIIPWQDQKCRRNARNLYNVITYPALGIVKNDGGEGILISSEGKDEIQEMGEGAFQHWTELAKNYKPTLKHS